MAGFVWSIISSLLGNALLHDDALNDIICGLVVVFCVPSVLKAKVFVVYRFHECFNLVEYKCMVFHSERYGGESGILVIYCEDRIWERESSWKFQEKMLVLSILISRNSI